MSLHDAYTDTLRSNNAGRIHRKAHRDPTTLVSSGPIAPPESVQSMLRTRTEWGGDFCKARPSIGSNTRGSRLQSTRYRSGSFDTSFASALRHQRSPRMRPEREHNQLHSILRHRDTMQSGLTSYSKVARRRLGSANIRATQSWRLRNPEANPYLVHNYRSLTDLRSSSVSGSTSSNHASFNAVDSSDGFQPRRTVVGRHGAATIKYPTQTLSKERIRRSPASSRSLAARRGVLIQNLSINRSTSSLYQRHSPTVRGRVDSRKIMSSTSGRLPGLDENGHYEFQQFTPSYYDYSESFFEDLRPINSQYTHKVLVSGQQASEGKLEASNNPQTTQVLSESSLGSVLNPAELPTQDNCDTSKVPSLILNEQSRDEGPHSDVINRIAIAELPSEHLDQSLHQLEGPFELDIASRPSSMELRRSHFASRLSTNVQVEENGEHNLATMVARPRLMSSTTVSIAGTGPRQHTFRPGLRASLSNIAVSQSNKLLSKSSNVSLPTTIDTNASIALITHGLVPERTSSRLDYLITARSRRPIHKDSSLESEQNSTHSQLFELGTSSANGRASQGPKHPEHDSVLPGSFPTKVSSPDHLKYSEHEDQLDGAFTPPRVPILSMAESNGKSTVDLLLEKHIESLGLMPASTASSASSQPTPDIGISDYDSHAVCPIQSKEGLVIPPLAQATSQSASLLSNSCFNTESHIALRPRRLFASSDEQLSAFSSLFDQIPRPEPLKMNCLQRRRSDGWLTLPSTVQSDLFRNYSRPTLESGDMADIDTQVLPPGCDLCSFSQLSLPTSFEGIIGIPNGHGDFDFAHQDAFSDVFAKHVHRRRRRVRIQLKRQSNSSASTPIPIYQASHRYDSFADDAGEKHNQLSYQPVELDGNGTTVSAILKADPEDIVSGKGPRRWSSITAAFPMPGKRVQKQNVVRRGSTRTHYSQNSQTSQRGLLEPLNSTRQRTDTPRLGSATPRLPRPDLGPSLNTLDLSIPYAEAPSTIYPSRRDTRSFFDDSPSRLKVLQRSVRRQLGMRPMRAVVHPQREASFAMKANLPMRNGVPIAPIGSPTTMTSRKRSFRDPPILLQSAIPLTDFTYRKKGMVERLKDWWRRQCIQKALVTRRKTEMRWMPGGVLV